MYLLQVSGSVHYLLATLYITCGWPTLDDSEKKTSTNKDEAAIEDDEFDESFDVNDWFTFDDDPNPGKFPLAKQLGGDEEEGNCSCVSLSVLTKMNQTSGGEQQTTSTGQGGGNDAKRMPNCTNLEDCCKTALEHIYEVRVPGSGIEGRELTWHCFRVWNASRATPTCALKGQVRRKKRTKEDHCRSRPIPRNRFRYDTSH